MTLNEIKAIAKQAGIKSGSMKKDELIRSIQTREGNPACFDTGVQGCAQQSCLWREECLAG
jgi:hypothetical protein